MVFDYHHKNNEEKHEKKGKGKLCWGKEPPWVWAKKKDYRCSPTFVNLKSNTMKNTILKTNNHCPFLRHCKYTMSFCYFQILCTETYVF